MDQAGRLVTSTRLIAVLTLGSRVLGLLRESVFGYYFSTSELLSAFRIAFMVPNLARRLFGEGALSAAAIPVLTESLESDGPESTRRFVGSLLRTLAVVLITAILAAEGLLWVWRSVRPDPALDLAALLLPYAALICAVALLSGVLNVRGHFATPAAAPMILNVAIVGSAVAGATLAGLSGMRLLHIMCGAVLLAGVAQLVSVGVALRSIHFFPLFSTAWRDPRVRRVVVMMGPMLIGLSAVQINTLADHLIAYVFVRQDGQRVGPAVLGYAQFLYQLPLGVFGISVATAVFPILSRREAQGDRPGMVGALVQGIRLSLFIALPASVGLLFVARPLVRALYERGAFDADATQRVAGVLFFYSLGITAYFIQHLLVRAFYAMRNSRTPARIAMWMVVVNFTLNLALVHSLEERGLALATAVCAAVQVAWLWRRLTRDLPQLSWRLIGAGAAKSGVATGLMALVLALLMSVAAPAAVVASRPILGLAMLVGSGVAVYALAAALLRIEELPALLRRHRLDDR